MVSFDDDFRLKLRELLIWRRDACLSPSVGLSQPWRFVVVEDKARRCAVIEDFKACNAKALQSYSGQRAAQYASLKLAGLEQAPGHLAVFAEKASELGHGLGRMTMPETIEYSVVSAISFLWLAARAEGVGLGWVSILDPQRVCEILAVPQSWKLIGYFCLGYPDAESDRPELERADWEQRRRGEQFTTRR
jgi:5,6-dimethylbenzimidazole synthase